MHSELKLNEQTRAIKAEYLDHRNTGQLIRSRLCYIHDTFAHHRAAVQMLHHAQILQLPDREKKGLAEDIMRHL